MREDKRKIVLSCSKCNLNFHRACHNSKYPKHECSIQTWECSTCNSKPLSLNTSINDSDKEPIYNIARGVKIGHINVRDLMSKSKLSDIKTIIARDRYDVFTVSETWLWCNNDDSEIEIDGYELLRCDRPSVKTYNKRGGGSLAYVNKKYEITEMKHNFLNPEKVQAIKFSIHKKYQKPIVILSIYRVADTPTSFIKQLEAEILESNDKEMFIIGDLNFDQLAPNENQLRPLIKGLGLQQLIKSPTRVTDKTKTLIDIIITNSPHCDVKKAGVIRSGISDHDIIFAVRKNNKSHQSAFETREVRNFKNIDINAARKMINQAPWWCLKMSEDINYKFEQFCEIIKIIMNTHSPIKKLRVKTTMPIWMTQEYKNCLTTVEKLKTRAVRTNDMEHWAEFKKLRNRCENMKFKLKMQSNMEHINGSENKSKTAWRLMNREIGKHKSNNTIKKISDGSILLDKEVDIANAFCDYFADVAGNEESPCTVQNIQDINEREQETQTLENPDITIQEVLKAIKYLKINKPVGSDGIPPKFYKLFADEIAPILVDIFNESLRQGKVPQRLKKTIIKSLYKGKGSKNMVTNYRPISIISATSKLFEHIMYIRLSRYLENSSLLSDHQYGYRKSRSTQSAVLHLTNNVKVSGDKKLLTGLVFIDFQKAFDSINHNLLIKKLQEVGVKDNNLSWFRSYFDKREFCVKNGSSMSHTRIMERGTPQGSSLSGLLFSIYINNIPHLLNCKCIFYADDLVMWYSSVSLPEIQKVLQYNINLLMKWCRSSSMKINVLKTKSMLMTPPRTSTASLNLNIGNEEIMQVSEFKYLGVILDQNLSWNEHYESVCTRMTKRSYLISRHKNSLSKKWLQIIVTSIVTSVLDYCLPVWGNLSKSKYARLDGILFRALKLIVPNNEKNLENKMKLFETVNWLTSAERFEFYSLSGMFRTLIMKSNLSSSMSELYIKIPESDRITRNKECFILPRMNTEFGKNAPFYQTIKVWNCLPFEIKNCQTYDLFEQRVRELLLRCRKNHFVHSEESRIINHAN